MSLHGDVALCTATPTDIIADPKHSHLCRWLRSVDKDNAVFVLGISQVGEKSESRPSAFMRNFFQKSVSVRCMSAVDRVGLIRDALAKDKANDALSDDDMDSLAMVGGSWSACQRSAPAYTVPI